jgi:hypothetical protein
VKVDFRRSTRELHGLQCLAIEVGTNLAVEFQFGVPVLDIQNRFLITFFLVQLAVTAVRVSFGWTLNGLQDAKHLPPSFANWKEPETGYKHTSLPTLDTCQRLRFGRQIIQVPFGKEVRYCRVAIQQCNA